MLAKNLVREIVKRGGTAEIVARGTRNSTCVNCGEAVTKHHVLNMNGPDYEAWFSHYQPMENLDHSRCADGSKHKGRESYELSGVLGSYDVHMFLSNLGTPDKGGNSCFTVRSISRRGEYDQSSDYNPSGWTFCNRLRDLDWACR